MRIAVPRETAPRERRVALVPESCKKLIQAGYDIAIESGAGEAAGFADQLYRDVGVTVETDPMALLRSADIVVKVNAPALGARDEVAPLKPGAIYLGSLMPLRNLDAVRALAARQVTAFSTDAIPRTTRAQAMDTLSSMANITGYKGVLLACGRTAPLLPHADDRRRHGASRQGLRDRRRRGRAAGHRHRQAAGRQCLRHRCPARSEGADRERRARSTSASSSSRVPPPAVATPRNSRPRTRHGRGSCWLEQCAPPMSSSPPP